MKWLFLGRLDCILLVNRLSRKTGGSDAAGFLLTKWAVGVAGFY